MFDRLKCLIKGHDLRVAQYSRAHPSWMPPSGVYHLDGRVEFKPARISGFMHYGLYSSCERCGKNISVKNDCGLPTILPDFIKEARKQKSYKNTKESNRSHRNE